MAKSRMPRGAKKIAKPVKGSKPKTPHDGSVYQSGGSLGGRAMEGMVMPREGKVSANTKC